MISKKDQQQTTINEIHEIMILLRGSNAKLDGDYRSTHLGTILEYLRNQQTENKSVTTQKLALMLGMAQRQIRENYIDGLFAFGVIVLSSDCSTWTWVGSTAIKNKDGQLKKNVSENESETPFMDSIKEKEKEKKE